MGTFNLSKGNKFALDKQLTKVQIAASWAPSTNPGENFDLDLWVVGLTQTPSGMKLFNDGSSQIASHTLGFFNKIVSNPNKSFKTKDSAIQHTGDNRVGLQAGVAERIDIDFAILPNDVTELGFFISIHEAAARNQTFSRVNGTAVKVISTDTGAELCQYNLAKEFSDATVVQIGSMLKDTSTGIWSFKAVGIGAPSPADVNTVIDQYV